MVKVLIYSSKELYDNSSYYGRAEAHLIAYSVNNREYQIVKNRYSSLVYRFTSKRDIVKYGLVAKHMLKRHVERLEYDEWKRDLDAFNLQEKYKDHPLTELEKNE